MRLKPGLNLQWPEELQGVAQALQEGRLPGLTFNPDFYREFYHHALPDGRELRCAPLPGGCVHLYLKGAHEHYGFRNEPAFSNALTDRTIMPVTAADVLGLGVAGKLRSETEFCFFKRADRDPGIYFWAHPQELRACEALVRSWGDTCHRVADFRFRPWQYWEHLNFRSPLPWIKQGILTLAGVTGFGIAFLIPSGLGRSVYCIFFLVALFWGFLIATARLHAGRRRQGSGLAGTQNL